ATFSGSSQVVCSSAATPRKLPFTPPGESRQTCTPCRLASCDAVKRGRADGVGSSAGDSLYEGRTLRGWTRHAMCKGRIAIEDGRLHDLAGWGRYLRRPATPA